MIKYILSFLILFISSSAHAESIQMAITVDDLPKHSGIPQNFSRIEITKKMLAVLKKNKIPEVYGFINAKKEKDDPALEEVLKLWTEAGYPLGNHTYSHQDLKKIPVEEFEKEIVFNEAALKQYEKSGDWHYFRYPYLHEGNTPEKYEAIHAYLSKNKYKVAQVTVDFDDWAWNDPFARCKDKNDTTSIKWLRKRYIENALESLDRAEIVSKHLFGRSIKHVLLLHIGAFDSEMISDLIEVYKNKNVVFIPLSEALKDPAYANKPKLQDTWGEFIYQLLRSRKESLKDLGLKPYDWDTDQKLEKTCL